jgi:hypothetical protein
MFRLATTMSLCLLLLHPCPADAQETSVPDGAISLYELVLKDGSRLFGNVLTEDDSEVVLRTQAGAIVRTRKSDVASLEKVAGENVDGRFLPSDPNATRLFFGPTGRSLAKGQTYLGVYEFVMPFVQVGITDRLSIGGGTPLVFGLEEWNRPFWLTPKLQVMNSARTQIAVGAFHVFDTQGDGGGVGYVVGTHGGSRGSFTAGAGMAYGTGQSRAGLAMFGGERQVSRNLKLISENYVWKSGHGVASGGIRLFGERLSADLAIGIPIGVENIVGFPVLNFVYVF